MKATEADFGKAVEEYQIELKAEEKIMESYLAKLLDGHKMHLKNEKERLVHAYVNNESESCIDKLFESMQESVTSIKRIKDMLDYDMLSELDITFGCDHSGRITLPRTWD